MSKKGFTLIELMIVIAIISILASIIIPNIKRARERAQLSACMENIKSLVVAAEMWTIDNPSNLGITWSGGRGHHLTANRELHPDYIGQVPHCPASGTAYYWWRWSEGGTQPAFEIYCTSGWNGYGSSAHQEILTDINGGTATDGYLYFRHATSNGSYWVPECLNQ